MNDFLARYPAVFSRLVTMYSSASGDDESLPTDEEKVLPELANVISSPKDIEDLSAHLWDLSSGDWRMFLHSSLEAYFYLGVNEEVRVFMRNLWVTLLRSWNGTQQREFIWGALHESGRSVNQALEFSSQIFAIIPLDPDFVLSWIRSGARNLKSQYTPGYSRCVANFTTHQTSSALQTLRHWLDSHPSENEHSLIARMLSDIRRLNPSDHQTEIFEIENFLGRPGNPDFRGLLIESWAFNSDSAKLDEIRSAELRDIGKFSHDGPEQAAWAFLLASTVKTSPTKWKWVYRELNALAAEPLGSIAKHWLIEASLDGWNISKSGDSISRSEWLDLFHSLLPLKKEDKGAFQKLEQILTDSFKSNAFEALELMTSVARSSGRAWINLHESDHTLISLPSCIRASGQANEVVTSLCLARFRQARRLGVWLLGKCPVTILDATLIEVATSNQLELLILEASLRLREPNETALLHACIFERVDEIGEPAQSALNEEIRIQALNMHGYREALKVHGGANSKITECIRLAEEEIDAVIRAAESPAIQMQVPARAKAEAAAFRRFSREVESAAEKYFPFGNFFGATVHILYSKKWRYYNGGSLSETHELKKSEVSTEMPRLEFTRPEEMRMRRIKALIRIGVLQKEIEDEGI